MNSKDIYHRLCESRKDLKEQWVPGSGIHRHHVLPKHSGGEDEESNYTYLTIREHIIAHYLLWRIYRNPNDLRSMNMLGAKLTTFQRKTIGEFCRDNKIGIHSATSEQKREWSKLGIESQKQSGRTDTFYWWSTKEGRKERARLGGTASVKSGNNHEFAYWASNEGRRERASMGGKSHTGKKCMYKPGDKSFKRVRPEDFDTFLANGYIFGSPINPRKFK